MKSSQEELNAIRELIRCVKPGEAEQRMRQVIMQLSHRELEAALEPVVATINAFLPKRRKELLAALEQRLSYLPPHKAAVASLHASGAGDSPSVSSPPPLATDAPQIPAPSAVLQKAPFLEEPLRVESSPVIPIPQQTTHGQATQTYQPQQEKVRFYLLARELNLDTKDLIALCAEHGIAVPNQLSTLEPEVRDQIVAMVKVESVQRIALRPNPAGEARDSGPSAVTPREARSSSPASRGERGSTARRQRRTEFPRTARTADRHEMSPALPATPSSGESSSVSRAHTAQFEPPQRSVMHPISYDVNLPSDVGRFLAEARGRLNEMSNRYIFTWSTWYREFIEDLYAFAVPRIQDGSCDSTLLSSLEDALNFHTHEIFEKGYKHKIRLGVSHDNAVAIGLYGLQRFLDLPVMSYVSAMNPESQRVCSAVLSGILQGYGHVTLGADTGWQLLPRFREKWVNALAFLTSLALDQIAGQIKDEELKSGLRGVLLPIRKAVDQIVQEVPDRLKVLPRIGEYSYRTGRLRIALELPIPVAGRSFFDIHCYLARSEVGRGVLMDEEFHQTATVIAMQVQPDLQAWLSGRDWLSKVVINADDERAGAKAFELLTRTLEQLGGTTVWNAPLTYNYAREFPLQEPGRLGRFRVARASVQHLLGTFEKGTGVHLWCSVRRSGKTTAGFDLSSPSGDSIVVTQTCQPTGASGRFEEGVFIRAFQKAVTDGVPLPDRFFRDTINECAEDGIGSGKKVVFVLDEYETLFSKMHLALRQDYYQASEYLVKPLLNQIVEFSHQNLVLFIGMQPNAHHILMDQDQLSPLVQQDNFPLFPHDVGGKGSEFSTLVRVVLGPHVTADPSFIDELHAETEGHPFLTVNVLVDLFDWLITSKRPGGRLTLTRQHFRDYAAECLTVEAIRRSPQFSYFLGFFNKILYGEFRGNHPWVYTVCRALLDLAEHDAMICSEDQFLRILEKHAPEGMGARPYDVLRTGAKANFFSIRENEVRPRIPMLARIALANG